MRDVTIVIRVQMPAISIFAGLDLDFGKIGIDDLYLMIALGSKLVDDLASRVCTVNEAVRTMRPECRQWKAYIHCARCRDKSEQADDERARDGR